MRALLYLRLRIIKNGMLSLVRNRKRLIFVIAFVAWMGLSLMGALVGRAVRPEQTPDMLLAAVPAVRLVALAILALLTLAAIERGLEGTIFTFAPPDYDFLFPTPIPRRLVVASRVLIDALSVFTIVGFMLMFFTAFTPASVVLKDTSPRGLALLWLAGGFYAVLVINLARIVELAVGGGEAILGLSRGFLRALIWIVGLGAVAAVASLVLSGMTDARTASDILGRPPVSLALLPMLAVVSFVTGDAPPILGSAGASLGLLGLAAVACAVGVCLLDRDVIEATIEHSTRMSRMRAAARSQDVERVLGAQIKPSDAARKSLQVSWRRPILALIYKSCAEMLHSGTSKLLVWALLAVVPGGIAHFLPQGGFIRYIVPAVVAYLLVLLGSAYYMRFRSELNHIPMLRPLPIPAWQQVLALVLPRTALTSALLIVGIIAFWIGRPIPGTNLHLATAMAVPLALLNAHLLAVCTVCLFPHATEPSQRFFASMLLPVGIGIALTPAVMLILGGATFSAPGVVLGVLATVGLVPPAVLLTLAATALFSRYEPGDD